MGKPPNQCDPNKIIESDTDLKKKNKNSTTQDKHPHVCGRHARHGHFQARCLSMDMGVPELEGFPYNFLFNGPSPNRPVPHLHSFNHQVFNVAI